MDNRRHELSAYRLEEAERCLRSAKLLYEAEDYKSSVNRSYYCVHNAMRSVFALQGKDYKKHSALMSFFRSEYIKTKIFSDKMSDVLRDLFLSETKVIMRIFTLSANKMSQSNLTMPSIFWSK